MRESALKKYQNMIEENGMAHLIFHVTEMTDVIHPFSVDGYELLADSFVNFLGKYRSVLSGRTPIVLEIIGRKWTKQEKELIDNTIWTHFCLNMDIAGKEAKQCIWKSIRYLIYTLLSLALVFAVTGNDNELVTNLAYVPFWFFGYRLLTYLILDLMPAYKELKWYMRLASAKLLFHENLSDSISSLDVEEVRSEAKAYGKEAGRELMHNKLFDAFLMDGALVTLGCKAQSIKDFILVPELKGREFLSAEMAAYLDQAINVVKRGSEVELSVYGAEFTEEEKQTVRKGIQNYFTWVMADGEKSRRENNQLILVFIAAIAGTSLILLQLGAGVDLGLHEFILILFWFFADYLLEFVLISRHNINKNRKIADACAKMKVSFVSEEKRKDSHTVQDAADQIKGGE